MNTVKYERLNAFAIWITGLPASGKSTVAASLKAEFAAHDIDAAVLESDVLRAVFTPRPTYSEEERETFYRQLVYIGKLLLQYGVPVIFDATANRRHYRDLARQQIPRFLEVFVDCPLDSCIARDPKGIYAKAYSESINTVPGLQAPYEPPERPEIVIDGARELPGVAARRIVQALKDRGWLRTAHS